MSPDPIRRANVAAIACEEQLQRSTACVAMFSSAGAAAGVVVYSDSDTIWMWTADDAVDIVVERGSAVDDLGPWTSANSETSADT